MRAVTFLAVGYLAVFQTGALVAAEQLSPERLLNSQVRFSNRLLGELAKQWQKGSNIVISPASIAGIMSVLDVGVDEKMHEAISTMLDLERSTAQQSPSILDSLRRMIF